MVFRVKIMLKGIGLTLSGRSYLHSLSYFICIKCPIMYCLNHRPTRGEKGYSLLSFIIMFMEVLNG